MSDYCFAVHTGPTGSYLDGKIKGGKKAAAKRDKIAKAIDRRAGYTYYYDEARREWRGWGYCANLGCPYDRATSSAIEAAWAAAGV